MIRSAKDKPAIVYMAVNRLNGKRYIGVTTSKILRRREIEHVCGARAHLHNGHFHRALRKHGRDAFEWVVLCRCSDARTALDEEVRLIAELKPEYNSTKGGEHPPPISEAGRERIKAVHRGNKYRLGMTHSPEVRELLRQYGIRDREKWSKRAALGPMSFARSVICLDTGRVFKSVSEAARAAGLSKGALNELCNGKRYRQSLGGQHFAFTEHVGQRWVA